MSLIFLQMHTVTRASVHLGELRRKPLKGMRGGVHGPEVNETPIAPRSIFHLHCFCYKAQYSNVHIRSVYLYETLIKGRKNFRLLISFVKGVIVVTLWNLLWGQEMRKLGKEYNLAPSAP